MAVGVRASDVGETVNVLQLGYQTGMNLQSVAVVLVDKGNIYLDIVENYVPMIVNVGPVAFDTWMEIRLDVTPPPAPSNVSLFIDGVLVQSDSSPLDPPTTAVRDTVLGVTASGKTENVVQFDDFLLSGTN